MLDDDSLLWVDVLLDDNDDADDGELGVDVLDDDSLDSALAVDVEDDDSDDKDDGSRKQHGINL